MNESDLRNLLNCLDTALDVYVRNEGRLTPVEISLKSMLTTVRKRVAEELAQARALRP